MSNQDVRINHHRRDPETPPTHGAIEAIKEILHNWKLTPSAVSFLDRYYLLRWNHQYFLEKNNYGMILHQGWKYTVLYLHGEVLIQRDDLDAESEVFLSFRKVKGFELGYVMVRLVKKSEFIEHHGESHE